MQDESIHGRFDFFLQKNYDNYPIATTSNKSKQKIWTWKNNFL